MLPRVADVHVHVIPPAVRAGLQTGHVPIEANVQRVGDTEMVEHAEGYRYPLSPRFYDTASLTQALTSMGTGYAVLSPAPPLFAYALDEGPARDWAHMVNDGVAAMVADDPHRFRGLATLPLRHPEVAQRELRRGVTELGLAGAIIGPHVEGRPLDDESLTPVLSAAEELGVVLFVHPYYTGAKSGLESFYLTNLVGNPLETCVCAARLTVSGTLERFAGLRVLLAHGGGFLPYQIGRLDHGHQVRPELAHLPAPPSSYVRAFYYDSLTHAPAATAFLTGLVGPDRVAFGTDIPFDMAGPGLEAQLEGTHLADDARRHIGFDTAAALFGFTSSGEQT